MATIVTKTIRASGGDYTTLSAWEAANQGDLVAADEVRVAECYNDWPGGLNDAVYLDGSTEDATRYLMITVAPGHRHDGTPGTGFHIRRDQNWLAVVRLSANSRARLEWLDVRNAATNGVAFDLLQGWATNCIARGGYRGFGNCRTNSRLVNCLAIGPSSIAAFELISWQNAQALNCVAAGASYGFRYSDGTGAELKNCVAYNNTTNFRGTYAAASTNNASSSASDDAPGDFSVFGVTAADFVDAANNDFHITTSSALYEAGTDLSGTFTTDIDGDTWATTWSIGFDQPAAGGGTPQTLTPTLYSDADTFYSATVAQSGGEQTLTPTLYTDADSFYSPAVAPGAVTLTPSLYADADTFYVTTVAPGAVTLTPSLYADADTFYVTTVAPGAVTLTPSLYADADTFHAATVALGAATLSPSLYADADTFHAPIVIQEGGPQYLGPSLYSDADTFHAATVTRGAVTLSPSLLTDAEAFYVPTVAPGAVTLTPSLLTDAEAFYVTTVAPGAVTLTPSLYADADTFYAATVVAEGGTQYLSPPLYADAGTFHAATVTRGAVTLSPSLLTDAEAFYVPTVAPGAVTFARQINADTTFSLLRVANPVFSTTVNRNLEF